MVKRSPVSSLEMTGASRYNIADAVFVARAVTQSIFSEKKPLSFNYGGRLIYFNYPQDTLKR